VRVALKIAYDGRGFHGHQRQPDVRTVEGECLVALRSAGILTSTREARFQSASRTDLGVSAVGNVISFDTGRRPDAVVGAFNDRARGVWAWGIAEVAGDFNARHALERWYRYHILETLPLSRLRSAAVVFEGTHDFQAFTSDPPSHPMTVDRVRVSRDGRTTIVDIRARSFRRGMIRRIIAAVTGHARGRIALGEIRRTLSGETHDFGLAPPDGLFLMDVRYGFAFQVVASPKTVDEWLKLEHELALRLRFLGSVRSAMRMQAWDGTGRGRRPSRSAALRTGERRENLRRF
jgi:tRNA pseudouridine38-40 synthase